MFPSVLKFVHNFTSLKIYGRIILKVSIKISTYNNIFFLKKQSSLVKQKIETAYNV